MIFGTMNKYAHLQCQFTEFLDCRTCNLNTTTIMNLIVVSTVAGYAPLCWVPMTG